MENLHERAGYALILANHCQMSLESLEQYYHFCPTEA